MAQAVTGRFSKSFSAPALFVRREEHRQVGTVDAAVGVDVGTGCAGFVTGEERPEVGAIGAAVHIEVGGAGWAGRAFLAPAGDADGWDAAGGGEGADDVEATAMGESKALRQTAPSSKMV